MTQTEKQLEVKAEQQWHLTVIRSGKILQYPNSRFGHRDTILLTMCYLNALWQEDLWFVIIAGEKRKQSLHSAALEFVP